MGLGNNGLKGFTPKRSETAANLLKVTQPTEQKKEEKIQIRISGDLYLVFKDICELSETTVSAALRAYIVDAVNRGAL